MSKTDAGFNGVGVAGNNLPSGPTGGRANLSEKLGRGGGCDMPLRLSSPPVSPSNLC